MIVRTTFASHFAFKDARQYVHSTTLIDEVMSFVEAELAPWRPATLEAAFHELIRSDGQFHVSEAATVHDAPRPAADVRLAGADRTLYVRFVPDASRPVTARVASSPLIRDFTPSGAWSATCRIEFRDRLSLVENTVEANKRAQLSAVADPASWSVLNLRMRRFPIGLRPGPDVQPRLVIENISSRAAGGGTATVNRLRFPDIPVAPFELSYLLQRR